MEQRGKRAKEGREIERKGRKKESEWSKRIQRIKVGELKCEVNQRRKRDR